MSEIISPWPPHASPEVLAFRARCQDVLRVLVAVPTDFFAARLGDPRHIHRRLYEPRLPTDRRHLAGALRGSDHPDLKHLTVAYALFDHDRTAELVPPDQVDAHMRTYARDVTDLIRSERPSRGQTIDDVARLAADFWRIRPFWQGNGHIQRITIEAILRFRGIGMSPEWAIHPCPFGVEMHRALAARDTGRISDQLRRFL